MEIKVKLVKVDEENPNPNNINVGYDVEGITFSKPEIDKNFIIYHDETKMFITTPVIEQNATHEFEKTFCTIFFPIVLFWLCVIKISNGLFHFIQYSIQIIFPD